MRRLRVSLAVLRRVVANRSIGMLATSVGLLLVAEQPARAALIVTMMEQGGNVVIEGSGSADVNGLSPDFASSVAGLIVLSPPTLFLGDSSLVTTRAYRIVTGPASIGVGGFLFATNGSGDHFGITAMGAGGLGLFVLHVPEPYVSRDPLSGTSVYAGATFASLGVTPGTYVWTWSSVAAADSFTLRVGPAVPEPASVSLLAFSVAAVGARRWRRGTVKR